MDLVSSERTIWTGLLSGLQTESSSAFGGFNKFLYDSQTIDPFVYFYSVQATQQSGVASTGIDAAGEASSYGFMNPGWCSGCAPGGAGSSLDVVFDVDVATPYALSGSLETTVTSWSGTTPFNGALAVRASLTPEAGGPAVASFELVPGGATPCCATLPVAASGLLAPGRYRLLIEGSATHPPYSGGGTRANYDVSLRFPGTPAVPAAPGATPALLALALLWIARGAFRWGARHGAASEGPARPGAASSALPSNQRHVRIFCMVEVDPSFLDADAG